MKLEWIYAFIKTGSEQMKFDYESNHSLLFSFLFPYVPTKISFEMAKPTNSA